MAIQDTSGFNNGKGGSHAENGPLMPGPILAAAALRGRQREILAFLNRPDFFNVSVILESGADNTRNIISMVAKTEGMELIPIGEMLCGILKIPENQQCPGPGKFEMSLLVFNGSILAVGSLLSQCAGVLLRCMGRGNGVGADRNMRMNHWGGAQQLLLLGSTTAYQRATPFLETELGRNGLGEGREGAMQYDLSFPGRGGFPRMCQDMFRADVHGQWGVNDLSWYGRYFYVWVGGPGARVSIFVGRSDEVGYKKINGDPDLVVSREHDPDGIRTINAITLLRDWVPGGQFYKLVPLLSPSTMPSLSDVNLLVGEAMLTVGFARAGYTQLYKARGGAIGGGKNYGPDEIAPSGGRNNVYKTPGSGLTTMEAMGPGGRAIGSENGALGESISCFHREH